MTFERNLNLSKISRDGYTFLDWFSDIGGIQGMLLSVIGVVVSIWNHNHVDNFIVQQLYQIKKNSKNEDLQLSTFGGIKDYICELLPSRSKCCVSSSNDHGLSIGRAKIEKEANIVHMI